MITIVPRKVSELVPYEKNPRKISEDAINAVAESIQEFGFKNPILIDKNNVIVAGHTRRLASLKLGLEEVPCVVVDDVSPQQIKALRLADNKTNELAGWDFGELDLELADLGDFDMERFGFDDVLDGSEFFEQDNRGKGKQEGNEEYNEFVDKFDVKHTTDDCYTPDYIYKALCEWVEIRYGVSRESFVRPFYPNGDYQRFRYPEGSIVVDNPPFSILADIKKFYIENEIPFFLFCPHLTCFSSTSMKMSHIIVCADIEYENGARISTDFVTSLEPEPCILVAPELNRKLKDCVPQKPKKRKITYPDTVITSARLGTLAEKGGGWNIPMIECRFIRKLENQQDSSIYGSGFLIGSKRAEELRAEELRAEELRAEELRADGVGDEVLELSDKEKQIVGELDKIREAQIV